MAIPARSPDIRLEDFLDDKLQSTADLDHLDTLIASVEFQRSQLESQLDDVAKELEETRKTSADRQAALSSRILEFQSLQQSIDARLHVLAASDAPDEAIRRLEQPLQRLHRVDLARRYLVLLQDIEDLRRAARSHLPADPKAALEPYSRLRRLVAHLGELQASADGAAVHMVTYVGGVASSLWDEMKQIMCGELEALLADRKWPRVDPESDMDDEWRRCFEKLLDLQVPELADSDGSVSVLPVDVMSRIWVKEFRFHFLSDRATSSPHAIAAHCFPWFLALVDKWEGFLRNNLTPMLASRLQDCPAPVKMAYADPVCLLIASLLPVLTEKVDRTMAEAVKSPAFLSTLMAQLLTFDDTVRSRFGFDGGDIDRGWGGLTAHVLDTHFGAWLRAEKDFALERFQGIVGAPDAGRIDYEFAGPGRTKPTHGAVRVTDLLRSVTSQYERVRRFSHKLRFLIDIQLAILDEYHDRLRGSLEAYQSLTSTVGRTLHGVTKEQLAALEGTGALETLCKVLGSADHVVNTLREWSNEEFFITLWEQLQTRAKAAQDQSNLAGGMSYEHVKDRTSSAVGTEEDGGVLFDETIDAYAQRRARAHEFLVDAVVESHQKAFRPYLQRAHWTTVEDPSAELGITAELDEPLGILQRNLEFLSRALGTAVFRRVFRAALERLNSLLWSEVLMGQSFTAFGAAQFLRDLRAVTALVEQYVPGGSVSLGSLGDAVALLNLPVDAEGVSLQEATDRVFTDNAEAKRLLEELEIDSLTPANARQILRRRVENSE